MADGDFVKGMLTIHAEGHMLRVSMQDSTTMMTEILDTPDVIRLRLWLKENMVK